MSLRRALKIQSGAAVWRGPPCVGALPEASPVLSGLWEQPVPTQKCVSYVK